MTRRLTLQERLCRALLLRGHEEVTHEQRTGRYRVFAHPLHTGFYHYVGSSGALRRGRSASSSLSMARTSTITELLTSVPERTRIGETFVNRHAGIVDRYTDEGVASVTLRRATPTELQTRRVQS